MPSSSSSPTCSSSCVPSSSSLHNDDDFEGDDNQENVKLVHVTDIKIVDKLGHAGRYTGTLHKETEVPHGNGRMEYCFSCCIDDKNHDSNENEISGNDQHDDDDQTKTKPRKKFQPCSYDGQWVLGDWCGYGKLYSIATIDLASSSNTAETNETYKEKMDFYEGGFFDNQKHGQGILQYSDGRVYNGTFVFDRMGKGRMMYPSSYNCEDDGNDSSSFLHASNTTLCTGTDTTVASNGTESSSATHSCYYWGCWNAEGQRHGRGKYVSADGRVYDGEFHKGAIEGHGKMTWPDGRWYLGEFTQGKANGLGMEVLPDGTLFHEGAFYDGKPVQSFSFRKSSSFPCLSSGNVLLYKAPAANESGRIIGSLVGPMPRSKKIHKLTHQNNQQRPPQQQRPDLQRLSNAFRKKVMNIGTMKSSTSTSLLSSLSSLSSSLHSSCRA